MSKIILPFRRPLICPGIAAGFDQSHIASGNIRYTGVANGAAPINLLNGQIPIGITGVFSKTIDGTIGPSILCSNPANTTRSYTVSGPASTPVGITIAGIARFTDLANNNGIFGDGPSSAVVSLFLIPNNLFIQVNGGTNISSSLTLTAGVPYFFAVSGNATSFNFLLMNLSTGAIKTQTVGGSTAFNASAGSYFLANQASSGTSMAGNLAAIMYNHKYMSTPQLVQWAQNPWLFWYPSQIDLATMLSAPIIIIPSSPATGLIGTASAEW